MSFVLNFSSCVAVGNLNPWIISPDWIVRQGILQDAECQITLDGVSKSFEMLGLQWKTSLNRFETVAVKEGADPGNFVADVLERLEHTPTKAVGSNFLAAISSPAPNLYAALQFPLAETMARELHPFIGGQSTVTVPWKDSVLRIDCEFEPPGKVVQITMNFNRDTLTARDAATAARQWRDDKDLALRILNHFDSMG